MKHLIDPTDLTLQELDEILLLAEDIIKDRSKYSEICKGKKLATLFFEPSTRTRLSFEAAMMELGGNVLGFSSADSSSAAKGESVADTARTVEKYADIIAMRHPKEGAPLVASLHVNIPVINAGDGGHNHPTQTLTDLLTIRETKHRLTDLCIGFCGDLKFGRTVHSLIKQLSFYENITFILISPEELQIPDYIKDELIKKNIPFTEVTSMDEVIPQLDILYMTRVQKERFFNEADYIRLKDTYILTKDKLLHAKEDLKILHPLPRVNEIAVEIDNYPRAVYFDQVEYGKFVRMALMIKLLGLDSKGGCLC
ncbi:MAG: aspartate carbamoyltransferase catalytic subunit [Clostridiales bacterium]|nr:aspartate carbamoyltransferase catalytic subunit [Clostridiales bacterium]